MCSTISNVDFYHIVTLCHTSDKLMEVHAVFEPEIVV